MTVATGAERDASGEPAPPRPPSRSRLRALARNESVILPIAAVVIALLVGALLMLAQGKNPLVAYWGLLDGALGGWDNIARTLEKSTPLIFTGLAVIVGLKGGLFNIGAQGQLLMGAIISAYVGWQLSAPGLLHVPVALAAGIAAGMAPAALAGWLKAARGVHEVITTIMLNAIIVNLTDWLAGNPWREEGQAITRTPPIQESARMPEIVGLPLGFFLAIAMAFGVAWLLDRTTVGYRIRGVGQNRSAAGYAGMAVGTITVMTMAISGGLAGLGGSVETLGVVHRYEPGFNAGLGFDGITVALLARSNPVAAVPSALLLGIMRAGATQMQFEAKVAPEIIDVISAIILFLVAAPVVVRWILRRKARPGEEVEELRLTTGWGGS
jgi:simple sugar transport system permease protein